MASYRVDGDYDDDDDDADQEGSNSIPYIIRTAPQLRSNDPQNDVDNEENDEQQQQQEETSNWTDAHLPAPDPLQCPDIDEFQLEPFGQDYEIFGHIYTNWDSIRNKVLRLNAQDIYVCRISPLFTPLVLDTLKSWMRGVKRLKSFFEKNKTKVTYPCFPFRYF